MIQFTKTVFVFFVTVFLCQHTIKWYEIGFQRALIFYMLVCKKLTREKNMTNPIKGFVDIGEPSMHAPISRVSGDVATFVY